MSGKAACIGKDQRIHPAESPKPPLIFKNSHQAPDTSAQSLRAYFQSSIQWNSWSLKALEKKHKCCFSDKERLGSEVEKMRDPCQEMGQHVPTAPEGHTFFRSKFKK
eukprot:1155693-Pelagomonas_calceolata.AAC.8